MIGIQEVIVVEGRYDKNTLRQAVDAIIIETSGFGIFNNAEKQKLLRRLAEAKGLIVLTDSDGAGFVIRNFIKSCVPASQLKHAYIPDIIGKERRKSAYSRERKLGVEGMEQKILVDALLKAGATVCGEEQKRSGERIGKADMYARGLSGKENSSAKRAELLKRMELPEHMTADGLLDVLNALMTREEFFELPL